MIIDKNTNIPKQPFKMPTQNTSNKTNNFILYDKNKYHDLSNPNDMANKSIAILQERLNKGEISLEDFNKMANNINKSRK